MRLNNMSMVLSTVGVVGIATTKVPKDTDPLFFWGTVVLAAFVVVFVMGLFITAPQRIRDKLTYGMGFLFVGLLLTMAVAVIPTVPEPKGATDVELRTGH